MVQKDIMVSKSCVQLFLYFFGMQKVNVPEILDEKLIQRASAVMEEFKISPLDEIMVIFIFYF